MVWFVERGLRDNYRRDLFKNNIFRRILSLRHFVVINRCDRTFVMTSRFWLVSFDLRGGRKREGRCGEKGQKNLFSNSPTLKQHAHCLAHVLAYNMHACEGVRDLNFRRSIGTRTTLETREKKEKRKNTRERDRRARYTRGSHLGPTSTHAPVTRSENEIRNLSSYIRRKAFPLRFSSFPPPFPLFIPT